jgi:hypothetical protein
MMKSPIVLLSALLIDVERLEPGVKGLVRDYVTIESRFENEGLGFLTKALPSFYDAFVRGLADGKFACPTGFRKIRGGSIPRLFSGMICEIFDPISGDLKEYPNIHIIKCLCEILLLFKKLTLNDDQVELLDREAKSKFFEVDDVCNSSFLSNEKDIFVLDRVARYILPNIECFDERELPLKHGPGAVSEQFTSNQKWFAVSAYSWQLENLGLDVHHWSSSVHSPNVLDRPLSDSARLISVPKNSTSRRTISVEPLLNQFVQQGYNTILRDSIKKCSILRRCIALTDQSKNQDLALEGSRTGKWATIDLSSASDLLSVRIVESVFKHRPRFLSGILECRSSRISCDGVTRHIEKFAGMGNATTFPVQSVVFATLAICALLNGRFPTYRNVQRVAGLVRVYGDDIVVPAHLSHQVCTWITSVGLKINTKKTFSTGKFRESCGVDAYDGVNVTPLYVRCHPGSLSLKEPSTIAHYVELCNHAWLLGLYKLSATLQKFAEKAIGSRLPLTTTTCSVLGLHSRQEAYEFQRWNPQLHRPELRGLSLSPVYRKDEIDGYAALLKCLASPIMIEDVKHLRRAPVRFKTKAHMRWVAA